jgi:hypothetical protein
MAKTYSGGVAIATGFKLNDPQPIVDYMVVDVFTDLAALPNQFIGMTVFCKADEKTYVLKGGGWVESGGTPLTLGETSTTAYRGDRGKTAYDHSLLTSGNPHVVTKTDVGLSNVTNSTQKNYHGVVSRASIGPLPTFMSGNTFTLTAAATNIEYYREGIYKLLNTNKTTVIPTLTTGSLVVGRQYRITAFVAGDNFTNVGGTNVTGSLFIASGTTPTT